MPFDYHQKQIKRNQKLILVVFIFCLVICLPMFYFPCLSPHLKKCQFPEDITGKLTLLDSIIYSYLPFIFTFIFSSMTLVILFKSGQLLKSVSARVPHETTSIAIHYISKSRTSIDNEGEINIKVWMTLIKENWTQGQNVMDFKSMNPYTSLIFDRYFHREYAQNTRN